MVKTGTGHKLAIGIALLVGAAFPISACGSSAAQGSSAPILVGVTAPLSGAYASSGTDILAAAKVTASEINAQGGVLGRKIQIVSADDQCNAQVSVQAVESLIVQKVVALAGGYCSGAAIPAVPILKRAGSIPFLAAASASAALTQQGYNNVFRLTSPTTAQGPLIGSFLLTLMQKSKIAILNDNTTFAKGLADLIDAYVINTPGASVTYNDAITPGQRDYSSAMTRVASSNPDAFVYTGYYPEAATLATEYQSLGLSSKFIFMGGGGVYDPGYLTAAGSSANGTYLIFTPDITSFSGPQVDKFKSDYKTMIGSDPGANSIFESDAINVLALAIKTANSVKPADITNALHQVTYNGITGQVKFDQTGERSFVPLVVFTVTNGQYVLYAKLAGPNDWVKV